MEGKERKPRSNNMSGKERLLLAELCATYAPVIDCKKTDSMSWKAKEEGWKQLAAELQASGGELREWKQLKHCFDNMKHRAKKASASDKMQRSLTGGGTFTPVVNITDEKVLALLGNRAKPLPNPFDGDAAYNSESVICIDQNGASYMVVNQQDESETGVDHSESPMEQVVVELPCDEPVASTSTAKCTKTLFGIAGVFVIATLTDHCCQLLISCKKRLIEQLCASSVDLSLIDPSEQSQLRARLHLTIGYGDVGRRAFGPWCFHLIQLIVCFTQFTTCICYFIFIGNTVRAVFPLHYTNHTNISALTNHTNVTYLQLTKLTDISATAVKSVDDNIGESYYSSFMSNTASSFMSFSSNETYVTEKSTAPDLRLIVLWVLPVFLITSLVRNVRYLAPLSLISSLALGVAIVMVLAFLIKDFSVNPEFVWYRFATLPLFFNQLISAYEGIGCILPIHCSMVGSRHMLRYYIHSNVYLIFFVLCTFGTVGYLRYGPSVEQLLVNAIEQHTGLAYMVDSVLLLSVVFTYPLQCFPVIEILERYILVRGQCRQSTGRNDIEYEGVSTNDPTSDDSGEQKNLLTESLRVELSTTRVAGPDIESVATWKRNTLRVVLTLITAGLAVLLRNSYAYVAAFTGAVGCSLLAFILPCLFDIKLRGRSLPRVLLIKDVVIIVLATSASISGLVYIGIIVYKGGQP